MGIAERSCVPKGSVVHANVQKSNREHFEAVFETPIKSELEEPEPEAPDGGWGWVVCFACFVANGLTCGNFLSFGLIYIELLEQFQEGKGNTAWILSLQSGVCFLIGPIAASLCQRYGFRPVAAAGSVLVCVSYTISIFAPNIYFLYFSIGIMSGFGIGMIYLPSIACVSIYFNKRRALATGLGVCGTGVGAFVLGPITSYLISKYTWKGTLLILGGAILNCIACAMVYRPLVITKTKKVQNDCVDIDEDKVLLDENTENSEENALVIQSVKSLELGVKEDSKDQIHVIADVVPINTEVEFQHYNRIISNEGDNDTLDKKALSLSRTSSCFHVDMNREDTTTTNIFSVMLQNIKESLKLKTLQNIPFLIFVISTVFQSSVYFAPYLYLPDTAKEMGIEEFKRAWLLSTIGITNTVGRVIFGAISDLRCVNRLSLYSTALTICGIVTMFGSLYRSFWILLLYCVVFGFSSGVTVSLMTVIIADMVGMKQFTAAFGLTNFFDGIAILIGPPFVGWLFDISGSYLLTYLVSGLFILISGVMLYFIPCFNHQRALEKPELLKQKR